MVACHCVRQMFDHVFTVCCCVSDSVPDGRVSLRPQMFDHVFTVCCCVSDSVPDGGVSLRPQMFDHVFTVCCCVSDSVPDGGVSLCASDVRVEQLQLPEGLRLLDRFLRTLLPHHVRRLLPASVPEHEEAEAADIGKA